MKKILLILTIFILSCNDGKIEEKEVVTDTNSVIISDPIDGPIPPSENIDSLNEARKKSRDSIRNLNSGK